MKVSIIIPTLNEEEYLPKLLESIKKQTFKNYEVIVADANSKDKTVKIARKYGAKVVKGGTPAVGRNRGAKYAKGDFLFFLDADVKLPRQFLEYSVNEITDEYLDLATCEFEPLSSLRIDRILCRLANQCMKIMQFSDKPLAPGFSIFVSKRLFDRVGGFDETLKMAEDHEFVYRANKFRRLKVLNEPHIHVSVRRLTKEGRLNLLKKYARVSLHRMIKGEITDEIVEYEFGNFKNKKTNNKLEKRLLKIEKRYNKIYSSLRKYFRERGADTKKFIEKYTKNKRPKKN
ncbi:glycosyltransferase [Candidatus Micrarchaeota archaeon]|nr:glycosyltransferase [Candidatus Micrarchaeota archaeon]